MYKFVPDSVGGVGSRRKLSYKTCDSCRKRHKRCLHNRLGGRPPTDRCDKPPSATTPNHSVLSGSVEPVGDEHVMNPGNSYSTYHETGGSECRPTDSSRPNERLFDSSVTRFIGNLSPEAYFFATGNQTTESDSQRTKIGVWLVARQPTSDQQQDATANIDEQQRSVFLPSPNSFDIQTIFPHLQTGSMSVLPPEHEFGLMSKLYFSKFDPIFPIIHDENLDALGSIEASTLRQCISLIASLDPSMKSHLRLAHIEGVMSQMEFRSHIARALKYTLQMGIVGDKMLQLQATALLAFFVVEPSSSEISSFYCAQAVEICQTLGLHVSYPGEAKSLEKSHRVFWCVWTLDKLNAATNGRPTLIHEQDIDEQLFSFVPEHLPAFRLFLRICRLLDEVISQYRPRPVICIDTLRKTIPDFESLVCEAAATEVETPLIATLELFYLSLRILGSRPENESDGPNQLPSSDAQSSSATSILSIASGDLRFSITYWVALPYAISLATSVDYQTLRNSKIPHTRNRAYRQFQKGRDTLGELSEYFVSARMMAGLAQDTLKEASKSRRHTSKNPEEGNRQNPGTQSSPFPETASRPLEHTLNSNSLDPSTLPLNHPGNMYRRNEEDLGLFDDLSSSDINEIFGGLDGDMDLSRVDALFSTNLNPTMPLIHPSWSNI